MAREVIPLDQAELKVAEAQPQADTRPYQTLLVETVWKPLQLRQEVPFAEDFYAANKIRLWRRNIEPYLDAALPSLSAYTAELREKGFRYETLRSPFVPVSSLDDERIPWDTYHESLIRNIPTRRSYMRSIDAAVAANSRDTRTRLAEAKDSGENIRIGTVFIGGSVASCIAASIVGPTSEKMLITNQKSVGDEWMFPCHTNSSAQRRRQGPDLPLLNGTTTRVIPSNTLLGIKLDQIAPNTPDSRSVTCENGSIDYLPAAEVVAASIKGTLASEIDHFLTDSIVDIEAMSRTEDGYVRLPVIGKDGTQYTVEAENVYICTGVGDEACPFPDDQSQKDYGEASADVSDQIFFARILLESGEKPEDIRFTLPRILTLSSIQRLYRFWVAELQAHEASYPFRELFDPTKRVGFVGEGDTTRGLFRFLGGEGPSSSYPEKFLSNPENGVPDRRIFGLKSESIDKQPRTVYKNLSQVRGLRTGGKPKDEGFRGKAELVHILRDTKGQPLGTRISFIEENGEQTNYTDDYTVIATGRQQNNMAGRIPESFNLIYDLDLAGNRVGRRIDDPKLRGAVHVCGTANDFTRDQYAPWITKLLDIFDAPNTVSIWANAYNIETQVYLSQIYRRPLDMAHLAMLREFIDENEDLNRYRL